MDELGWWGAAAFCAGMAALGVVACAAPGAASALYGVPQHDPGGHAWVRAAGLRDLGLSAVLGWFLATGRSDAAGAVLVATAAVAVSDVVNVVAVRGPPPLLTGAVHLSGIALGFATGFLLLGG
jgi:hypothetical protein